jgi:isocitrate lyase
VPPKVLEEWLELWRKQYDYPYALKVSLKPHAPGSDVLELRILSHRTVLGEKVLSVVFTNVQDRRGRHILTVRDQNTFDVSMRQKRLMTLAHLFLIHRYKVDAIHYLTPSEDNERQTEHMKKQGLFSSVNTEVGEIIVADVEEQQVKQLLAGDRVALKALIAKS